MGLFDNLKNVFGGKDDDDKDITKAPSQILREEGIDPSGIKFSFGSDGTVTLNGTIGQESDRKKILDALEDTPGIKNLKDNLTVATAPPPPPPQKEVADSVTPSTETIAPGSPASPATDQEDQKAPAAGDVQTYTVVSGDTLWKISSQFYGDGSKYTKIFDANRDKLDDPDRIFPGQELVIPPEGD